MTILLPSLKSWNPEALSVSNSITTLEPSVRQEAFFTQGGAKRVMADRSGRANAWTRGADGVVIGLVDYPGGMPGVFASGVEGLAMDGVSVRRADDALPASVANG